MARPFREVLGSVFPSNYDVRDEIKRLRRILYGQREVAALRTHAGWRFVREKIGREIEAIESTMANAAQDPIKNRSKLVSLAALRTAWMGMVALIEIPDDRIDETETLLEGLLTKLKEDNRTTSAQEDEDLG